MIPVADALAVILAHARLIEAERVPLAAALGRTLREDIFADADSPPFDASAMDGYAARRADLHAPLRIVGVSQAGGSFRGVLQTGECIRIFTGAPVPSGAECVIRQEDATRDGDIVRVTIANGPPFIRKRGENRRAGERILQSPTRLGPPELAALAATGNVLPLVARRVRCAHLVTGNEIVPPEKTPAAAQIRDSNSTLVAALVSQHGGGIAGYARVDDDLEAARAAADALPDSDILFISGGASVGEHDFARPVLTALGYEIHFQRVDLRPGKPLVFASRGARLAFALPGNPVSHWVVFQLFIAPLLAFLQSGTPPARVPLPARIAAGSRWPAADRRQTYWPCRATPGEAGFELMPLPLASSGDALGLAGANALLQIPAATLDAGREVRFIPCP